MISLPILLSLLPSLLSGDTSYQVDFVSRYIWRGFDLNPDKEPVFQPSLEYEFGESGLSMNLWMSFSFVNKELNETDFTLAYTRKLSGQFFLEAGLIHYGWYFVPNFRFEEDTSHEVYVAFEMQEILFNPRIRFFYDFTNGDGIYVLMESEYSFEPMRDVETSIHASLGYNGGQWLEEGMDPGISDLNLGISLAYAWHDLRIVPFANYTFVFLDAIGKQNHFWFGVSLIFESQE